jgi:cell division protease FtsH
VPLAPDVDTRTIARGTPGFSGADLANLVNEAALLAARASKRVVTMAEFEAAKDKVMMGTERRSMVMTEDDKKATAVHEAGHSIITLYMPEADPLHKVTIIPRGRALGVTMSLPERDVLSHSKIWCISRLAIMFGGRVAEQLVYGDQHLNTGAGSDIQQATDMARRMVTEYGFSETLGPLRYSENEEEIFLGRSVTQHKNVSDSTAQMIDNEIRSLISDAEKTARKVLTKHRKDLDIITQSLLDYETLSGAEVLALTKGEKIVRPEDDDSSTDSGNASSVPSSGPVNKSKPKGGIGNVEPQPGS